MKDVNSNKKFIESYDISDFEILSDSGWIDAVKIHKTIPYKVWIVTTEKHQLSCADDHVVFNEHMQEVFVKDLHIGNLIQTEDGIEEVLDVKQLSDEDSMYDVELPEGSSHRYYTDGILSHNTTTYTVFCLWYTTLFSDKKIMLCANKLQTVIGIMDRIRKAYEQLPFFMKPGILTYNKGEIVFSNGSAINAYSTSSSAARGSASNCLVIDEMAFIPKNIIDSFFASVLPTISSSKNSKSIIVSTPNGASGLYYDLWQQANSRDQRGNKEGWKPFRIHWWETGGIRDEEWKKQQIASIGIERWKQEFECDFLTSTTARMIPDDVLEKYRMVLAELKAKDKDLFAGKKQMILSQNQDKAFEFTMWHEFQEDKTYVATGDVAEGGGGDESVLYVWDITDLKEIKMCAMFASNKVSPIEFAYITAKILQLYCSPYYICERNGLGSSYLDSLRITYGYDNIVKEAKNNEVGIASHGMTKSKACLWAKDMMTTKGFGFKVYDKELVDQLGTFCKKNTNGGVHLIYAALPNCHDDHVMAFIWLCWMLNPEVIERYYAVCKTFTSEFGNIYPELVQPIQNYSSTDIKKATDDPVYQDFLDFKEQLRQRLGKIIDEEKKQSGDIYWQNQKDPYFNDTDIFQDWRSNSQEKSALMASQFSSPPKFYVF